MNSNDLAQVRDTLWKTADELRANSTLPPNRPRALLGDLSVCEHRFDHAVSVRLFAPFPAHSRRAFGADLRDFLSISRWRNGASV